eukprot:366390-Chlamydomonas_euryale.AAC.17
MQRGACSHARGLASDNGLTVLFRQTDAAENACSECAAIAAKMVSCMSGNAPKEWTLSVEEKCGSGT